jgi:4-amino-4-deoxy-L-arabinose transferase-like glycosyltransferase
LSDSVKLSVGLGEPVPPASGHKALWVLLALAAFIRVAVTLCFAGHVPSIWDERDYDTLGTNLVEHGEFAFSAGQPISQRPPLYSVLVAGTYAVCGVKNYQAVRFVQDLLSLATLVLVYALGHRLFCRRVGIWAAGWYALYPSLLIYNDLMLTECLFTFLLVLMLWILARAVQSGSGLLLAVSGVVLGLAALTRSVLWLLPAPLGLLLLFFWPGSLVRRAAAACVFVAAFAATLAPWSVRNTLLEKTFITIDTMGGRNVMMGNYEHTPFHRAWDAIAIEGEQSWHHVLHQKNPDAKGKTQGQIDKLALREGIRFALAHPWLTLKRDVVKFVAFWGLERELVAGASRGFFGEWSKGQTLLLALTVFGSYALSMILGFFGLFMLRTKDRFLSGAIWMVAGFICALHTISFGHSRYHLPLMPLVFLFAAAACVHRREIWRQRWGKASWLGLACSVLLVSGWVGEVLLQDWEWVVKLFPALS